MVHEWVEHERALSDRFLDAFAWGLMNSYSVGSDLLLLSTGSGT